MKYLRIQTLASVLAIALAAALSTPAAHAADTVSISAVLILGSNEGAGVDAALRPYEQNLKKHLRFDTFKRLGGGRTNVALPGLGAIAVGDGQSVALSAQPAGDGKYRISAQWTKGSHTLVNTTVVASKGLPTVLVGPSSGGSRTILLMVAE